MPALHTDVYTHGERALAVLQERLMQSGNWMSFADYMQFCLYEPELGYYSGGLHKFGAEGDFVTAPELSPLFGECIADWKVSECFTQSFTSIGSIARKLSVT